MNRTLLTVGTVLSTSSLLLVDSAIKGGVLLLLAALVAVLLRRDSAATRHLVWQVSIVGMLVVPVFSVVLPQWRVLPAWAVISAPSTPPFAEAFSEQIPYQPEGSIAISTALTPSRSDSIPSDVRPIFPERVDVGASGEAAFVMVQPDGEVPTVRASTVSAEIISEPPLREWRAVDALPILWLIGFSVLIVRLMAARVLLWSGERRGRVVVASQNSTLNDRGHDRSDEAIIDAFKAGCRQLSVSRPVRLLMHSGQTIPVVWGIFRLRLLLPANARSWSAEQLQSVLLHELAHIKRRDAFSQLLVQVACALHWFNPLVWFAAWRLHVERERACDDLVLANGVPPSAYAEHLLDVATRLSTAPWTQACGLAMARKSSLEGRLVAVLNKRSNRRSVSVTLGCVTLIAGIGIAIPLAMLRAADGTIADESAASTGVVGDADSDLSDSEANDASDVVATNDVAESAKKPVKEDEVGDTPAKKRSVRDWPGRFVDSARQRRLDDGSYPPAAYKYLRQHVAELLRERPNRAYATQARAWMDATAVERNWSSDEFEKMVREICSYGPAFNVGLALTARRDEESAARYFPKEGEVATPEHLKGLSFGPAAENGLRVAWGLDPSKKEYAVGEIVKYRVVIHNSGKQTVQFMGPGERGGQSSIRDRRGEQISAPRTVYANLGLTPGSLYFQRYRLKPGQFVEFRNRHVGIGISMEAAGRAAQKRRIAIWPLDTAHVGDVVLFSVETGLSQNGFQTTKANDGTVKPAADATAFYEKDELPEEQARDWSGVLRSGVVKINVVAAAADPPVDDPGETPTAAAARVWSTRRAGNWQLAGGVTMEVKQELVHATDVASTAILTWPQDKDGGTARHKIWLAGDAFTNREPWLLAWERDSSVLWALKGEMQSSQEFPKVSATPAFIRRIDFSDPQRITETTWASLPEATPGSIREKLTEGFLPMKSELAETSGREPGHRTFRAEDVRPVNDLLSGKWIAQLGDATLSVTFENGTNFVKWVAPNPQDPTAELITETLTRLQSTGEDSVRLIRDGNSPAGRRSKLVARLKRGIGSTLLVNVFDKSAFPKNVDTSGIVLHREFAIADNVRPAAASTSVARPAAELKPEDRFAQTLFKIWQANARSDGKIPGGLIGRLGEMVEFFNQFNKDEVKELVAKFEAMLPRFDATVDWSQADAVALLDDVAAVNSIPLLNTSNIAEQRVILTGEPLPPELVDAPWGEPVDNGLRVAWHLSPRAKEYRLGTSLKSRILVHNSGEETVIFSMPSWQQSSSHTALDDGNKAIKVSSTEWTMMASMKVVRLAPGAYYETPAPGIGVGPRTEDEDWAHVRPGAWIEAKEGDDVRLTPGLIEVRSSPRAFATSSVDGRPTSTDPKDAVEFWDRIVTERLDREMPLPTGAADRELLLRRVVRDLFGVEPSQDEIDAYVADKSPGALHPVTGRQLLKTRVTHLRSLSPFTGTLPSGDIAFRVLAADPDAANRPRVATGPGYYNIADKRRLSISQSLNGNRRINSATIQFHRQYYYSDNGKPAPGPHAISLPDGRLTYAIVWDRDANELWVTQKGLTRRYDFSDPYEIKETQFKSGSNSNIPERLRNAVKAALNLPDTPVQEPESPKASDAKRPDAAPAKLEPGDETNFKWGATVNGVRAALRFRRPGDAVNDLYVVVQNVSAAPIHIDDDAAENEHTLWIRRNGIIQSALSSKEQGMGDVILQPREVTFVPVFSLKSKGEDGHTIGWMMAENALKDPTWTMSVDFAVAQTSAGAWRGQLATADTNGVEAAVNTTPTPSPAAKPDTSQTQSSMKLEPGRADNLQWGEPVNGLRAALIRPPALGSPESTQTKDFQMVIQNVAKAPVRLVADATAPNPRELMLMSRKHGWIHSNTRIEEPSNVDFLLQPGDVAVLDMLPREGPQGSSISRNLDVVFFGKMSIEKAPPGAWTGTLATAGMQAAFAAHGLLPKHKDARALFIIWNQGIRWDRTFPGGLIGLLAESVKTFTDSNPTWKTTPELLKVLPRLDVTRDWAPLEVLALLDEVAAIQASPIQAMLEKELQTTMRRGKPLSKELENAPWGEAHSNGLRVAWMLDPAAKEYRLGTPLTSRILFHNSGKNVVVFRTQNWRQSGQHKAKDANEADVRISSTSWTTRALLVPCRLYPGEFIEVAAAGIGVGPRNTVGANWKGMRVGSWIEAKNGDEVTLIPEAVLVKDRKPPTVLIGEDDWWYGFITARLAREKPLPMDDEVRRRLVYHVGLDLGTSHSDEITNAFLADRSPDALDALARRLVEQSNPVPFAGTLKSGPTTFRVLAADRKTSAGETADSTPGAASTVSSNESVPADRPAAATTNAAESEPAAAKPAEVKKPVTERPAASRKGPVRSANHSGSYSLKEGRRLIICRPTVVKPWLAVVWEATDQWPESRIRIYPRVSEQNYRNWAVVWEPDADELWFVDDTAVTHVDITNPAEVLTTRQDFDKPAVLIFKFPEKVRQEFQRLGFEIPRSKQSTDNHVTDGQAMLAGESLKMWTVEGTVTGQDGKPMKNVPIRMRTAYHPTIDVVTTKTDAEGNYRVNFRLDLRTIARCVFVEPVLDGFTDRDGKESGLFDALLHPGEKPHSVKVRRYPPLWITGSIAGENEVGPIRRFSKRDLIPGQPARADFVMLPASVITGQIVDPDGKPLASRYVSVTAPDTVRPRGYETVASAQSDKNGGFKLTNIPANELLNFTSSVPGRNWEVSKSASQLFGSAAPYQIRIITGPGGKGGQLKIERVTDRAE